MYMYFADFGDIIMKKCRHPVISFQAILLNFVAFNALPGLHFIAA